MTEFQCGADPFLLEELVGRYQDKLFGYLLKLARDRDIAADLCQQTWLKLIEAARSGGYRACGDPAFRSFLFTIARNLYIDRRTRSSAVSDVESLEQQEMDATAAGRTACDHVERTVQLRQLSAHLIVALDMLPSSQRSAVDLWATGETAEAAARSLAVPRDTFLSRKKYAFAKLRRTLEARGIAAEFVGVCP